MIGADITTNLILWLWYVKKSTAILFKD